MRTSRPAFISLLASTALCAAAAAPAWAQTADQTPATLATSSADTDARAGQIADIVVTAQRRAESAQKVPIAIAAVSAKTLEVQRIVTPTDLGAFVPGLNISRANVASIPFLRGVGNFTATPGNEAAIATYVDDVYYASPTASTYDFNNLARIEVLKGPQGTLFGRNAAGGVINIVTRDPADGRRIEVNGGYGNYNSVEGNLYASTGLQGNFAGDIAIHYAHQGDGWGTNLFNGQDIYLSSSFSARSKLEFRTGAWKFRLIGDYSDTRNDSSVVLSILPGTVQASGYTHQGGFYATNQDYATDGHQTQYGASLRIDGDLGFANIASISAWRRAKGIGHSDGDASPLPTQTAEFRPRQTTFTQELQLSSPTESKVKWIVGFYYFDDKAGLHPLTQTVFAAFVGGVRLLEDDQKTHSYAGYAQATFPVFDNTNLTAGIRYTDDNRSIYGRFYNTTGVTASTNSGSDSWGKVTYRAAVDHQFTSNVLGYASYSRGFKSGNFNVNNPAAAAVKPMVLDAYEVGFKSDLLGHTLRFNGSAFYYDFEDLQVQQSIVGTTIQTNAASARYKGIDLDLIFAASNRLTLTGSLEVLDAEYKDFPNATFNFPCKGAVGVASCTRNINGGGYYTAAGNAGGLDIPYADKFTATGTVTYVLPTGVGPFTFGGNIAYHNGFYFDVQNTLRQPAYTLLNGSIEWRPHEDSGFSVRLWSKNITGAHTFAQQQVNASVATYSAQPPFTIGGTLGFRF